MLNKIMQYFDGLRIARKKKALQPGQRVQIVNYSILNGEKATIIDPPYPARWGKGEVWIRYDKQGAVLGPEKGYAILSDSQHHVDNLEMI